KNVARPNGRSSGGPRIMPHAYFNKPEPEEPGLRKHFRIDEKLLRLDRYFVEYFSPEKLKRAINVTHADSKHDSNQQVEPPRQNQPREWIESVDSKSANDVRVFNQRQQVLYLADIKLKIRIREEQQFVARVGEAGLQRFSVPAIRTVMKNSQVRGIIRGNPIRDRTCSIHGAVINHDDLPIAQAQ